MTPEQRLDRLERIAKLLAKPCPRARHPKKSAQSLEEYIRAGGFIGLHGARLAQLTKSQEHTNRRLDALTDKLRKEFDGDEEMLREFDGDFDES